MIVTIWWEDERQGVRSKVYGPDQLLAACVADDLGCNLRVAAKLFRSAPLKGAGKLRSALRDEASRYELGPLCAVFDRDKILNLWPAESRPQPCKLGISRALRGDAPGEYELVLLFQNMETVVAETCRVLGRSVPPKGTVERDKVLQSLAFNGTHAQRQQLRDKVDGLGRLVDWTVRKIGEAR